MFIKLWQVRHRAVAAALAAAYIFLVSPQALAQSQGAGDKLDAALRHRTTQLSGRSRVIVQFTSDVDVRALPSRSVTLRRLDRQTQVAELDNAAIAALAADARVERLMLDRRVFATLERTGLATGATSTREDLGLSGKGVGVAVIDSGVAHSHPDLRSSGQRASRTLAHFKDFTGAHTPAIWTTEQPYDDYGHGTHVSGIIAGNGSNSDGRHTGLAPGANLVSLKVLDADGHGYVSDVIAAIDYAVAIRAAYNVRIINLSVGTGVFESYWLDPLTLAARRAVDAGIVVVAAAGNLGLDQYGQPQSGAITSPGNAPWVLTVGASSHQGSARRSDDVVADFSSSGPTWIDFNAKPDLIAPGVGTVSLADPRSTLSATLADYLIAGTADGSFQPYLSLTGTSMAAPVVAGAVALLLEANPALTPNAVKAILQYTAQVQSGTSPLSQGAGMLNVRGAVRLARFFGSPVGNLGAMGDTIEGEWVAWARHIVWGNYRISGGVPLPGSNAWTAGLTWGALETTFGAPVVWGARADENIVWSTARADDRDNIVWSTARATDDNIVWSTARADNIVWSTARGENIVWSTARGENIVWSTATVDNVVWGADCGGLNCQRIVWGAQSDGVVWGTARGDENIVWSTARGDNIVWSTAGDFNDNIVWSTRQSDNIVWSTARADNIVWSTSIVQPVLWAFSDNDHGR